MLVITRRKFERILIGDDIEIVVVDIGKTGVRIGITAPKSLNIVRVGVMDPESKEGDPEGRIDAGAPQPADIIK